MAMLLKKIKINPSEVYKKILGTLLSSLLDCSHHYVKVIDSNWLKLTAFPTGIFSCGKRVPFIAKWDKNFNEKWTQVTHPSSPFKKTKCASLEWQTNNTALSISVPQRMLSFVVFIPVPMRVTQTSRSFNENTTDYEVVLFVFVSFFSFF